MSLVRTRKTQIFLTVIAFIFIFPTAPVHSAELKGSEGLGNQTTLLRLSRDLVAGNTLDLKNEFVSLAVGRGVGAGQAYLQQFFSTAELQVNVKNPGKPTGGLLLVLPLSDREQPKYSVFGQGSIFRFDGRTTVNFGMGYRRLVLSNQLLFGINAFYDHEFPYDHARTSFGLEAKTTVGALNVNLYNGRTSWKRGRAGFLEKGLNGEDLELSMPLPYVNWITAYARAFKWKSEIDSVKSTRGSDFSLKLSPPISDGLQLEIGRRDYKSESDMTFITLNYNLALSSPDLGVSRKWASKVAYTLASMEQERFTKVRRENLIFKQKRASGTLTITGF
jgi:hypothetical protein